MDNIIVGGGITGLLTAYRLIQKGEKVLLIEKGKDLGGLLASTDIEGKKIERFYHHIFKNDTKAIGLINQIGLGKKLKWHKSSVSVYYDGVFRSFRSPIDLLTFGPIKPIDRLKTGLATLYLQKNKDWKNFEKIPAYKWIKKHGGESAYKVIWEPLLRSKFGNKYKQVSMAWFWGRIFLRGKSAENGVEKLGYLNGSFGQIIDVLTKEIKKKGGKIFINQEVLKIISNKNEVTVETDKNIFKGDRVIATVASDQLAKILGKSVVSNKLNQIGYVGVINAVFSTDQDLTDYYWNNINDLKSPFVALVKHSQLVEKYNGKHVYYLGCYIDSKSDLYMKDDAKISKIFLDYLKNICPDFKKDQISQIKTFKFSRAQQITSCDYKNKIVDFETGIDNVYLINFSQIYPWDRGINWAVDRVDKLIRFLDR